MGYKAQTAVCIQTKGPLFTQKAMALEQLEEDHMGKKIKTIMLLHPNTKTHYVSFL